MRGRPEIIVLHVQTPVSGRLLVRAPARPAGGLLVGFHGYAEGAETHLERLLAISGLEGWVVVSVEALNRFYRSRTEDTVAGWMTRQDRELAISANLAYVDRVVEQVRKKYELSVADRHKGDSHLTGPDPLMYAGFSQGVAMAFRAAVRGRWSAAGVIACGGDVPPELLQDAGSRFPPTLLIRGARDDWYTQAKLDDDLAALHARGVDATPAIIDAAHEWTPEASARAAAFVRTVSASASRGPLPASDL